MSTSWAMRFHGARLSAKARKSHASCALPSIERAGAVRQRRAAQRHVLPEGAIGGGAPAQEGVGMIERLGPSVGIIVLHLVIVPGRKAWRCGMERLEVPVGAVLGVAVAVGAQI